MGAIMKVRDHLGAWIDIPCMVGKSAYLAAVEGGYTGSESDFNASMAEVANKATLEEVNAAIASAITGAIEESY